MANISDIYEDDLLMIKAKKSHLGYMGCKKLLDKLTNSVQYMILSEFWCGKTDIRFDIAKYLSLYKSNNTSIIPGEIGLTINLDGMEVKCSCCNTYSKNITVIKPIAAFGNILYICQNCLY